MRRPRFKWTPHLCLILSGYFIQSATGQLSTSYIDFPAHNQLSTRLEQKDVHGGAHIQGRLYDDLRQPGFASENLFERELTAERRWYETAVRSDRPIPSLSLRHWLSRHSASAQALPLTLAYVRRAIVDGDERQATQYLEAARPDLWDTQEAREVAYERGKLRYAKRQLQDAQDDFELVTSKRDELANKSYYHLGRISVDREDHEEAISHLSKALQSPTYKSHAALILCQIHMGRSDYDQVVQVGERALNFADPEDKAAIEKLMGRAYYEMGDTEKSKTYLSSTSTTTASANDRYRLAQLAYEEGDALAAEKGFASLAHREDQLGEQAAYFLAHSAMRRGDHLAAKQAFAKISRTTKDVDRKNEALYNDGLLSAQLGRDREAAKALLQIPNSSKYYQDAQQALNKILLQTSDLEGAQDILSSIPESNARFDEARQHLHLERAHNALAKGDLNAAASALQSSLRYPSKTDHTLQATYLLGWTQYRQGNYPQAENTLQRYKTQAPSDHPSIAKAEFLHAMIPFRSKSYAEAQKRFELASRSGRGTKMEQEIWTRLGDCAFHRRQYADALSHYQNAAGPDGRQKAYATYQMATLQGLQNDPIQQLVLFEQIPDRHPNSIWAPRALIQASQTYLNLGRYEDAAPLLDRLLTHYKTSEAYVDGLLLSGLVYYNQGVTARALEQYKKVFDHSPAPAQAAQALKTLEEIYIHDLKDPDGYITFVQTETGGDIGDMKRDSLYYSTAQQHYSQQAYQPTIEAVGSYLSSFPKGIYADKARFIRAESLMKLDRPADAFQDYKTLSTVPSSSYHERSLVQAADIAYRIMQDYGQAIPFLEQLLASDMDKDIATNELQLSLAHAYFEQMDYPSALTNGRRTLQTGTLNEMQRLQVNSYVAKSLIQLDRDSEALPYLKDMPSTSGSTLDEEARYLLGMTYYDMGDKVGARQALDHAVNQGAESPYWVAKSILLTSNINFEEGKLFEAQAGLEAILQHFASDSSLTTEAEALLTRVKSAQATNDLQDTTSSNK